MDVVVCRRPTKTKLLRNIMDSKCLLSIDDSDQKGDINEKIYSSQRDIYFMGVGLHEISLVLIR